MGNTLLALFLAAGVATLVYTKLGSRVGYGNAKSVWQLVLVSFVLSFIIMLILLHSFLHLN